MKRQLCVLMAIVAILSVAAQDEVAVLRPVTSAFTIEAGSAHIADSYLTPLHYNGWNVSAGYERFQAMRFDPERWIMRLNGGLSLARTVNPARNAALWNVDLRLGWGMMRRWSVIPGLTFAAGGSTSLSVGALYLSRNGNNPVSAKAAWTVNATGMATYSFRLGKLPITLRYQPELPVIGAFFSPDYGELYYEIYLGDHSNLVHCAWWGNRFVFDQLLTADFRFGATALRVGYRGHILNSRVNNIISREYTHSFVIGVSGEWFSVGPRGISPEARTISAYY